MFRIQSTQFLRDTSIDNFLAKIRTRMSVTNEVIYAQEPSGNINLHQIVAFPVYLKTSLDLTPINFLDRSSLEEI
ncbi:MAG: hypothetical protein CM15mP12_6600 [Gammaproteobacteria bacterium]|nr:MAG: hypothetical protein CM15mP12_6600 [Gammaproteobacteria bacterium]